MKIHDLVKRLAALDPSDPRTNALRRDVEHVLMQALRAEGIRASEQLVASLNAKGHRFVLSARGKGRRQWREELDSGQRVIDIYTVADRVHCISAVRYQAMRRIELSPRARRIQALRQRFYDRYMVVGQRAYRNPGSRLSPAERTILLVGELEADLNNGGFSQYVLNKGKRRARAALAALTAIRATRTATLLAAALARDATPAQLGILDARFNRSREDLATLVMQSLQGM